MNIFEELEKNIKESFASTLQEKLIYCQGFLEGDEENEDLYNFIGYLLWSSHENTISLSPSFTFDSTEESYRKCNREKCKTCTEYKKDVLFSRCRDCKYFSQWNIQDLYSEKEIEKNAKQ